MAFAFLPWTNISDTFTGVPGGPVAVVPWGNHFALFATDNTGTVRCAGAYMQTGLMGTWAQVSIDFSGPPGAAVTVVPSAGTFAVCAVDSTGAVCTASGDPQNDLSAWTQVPGLMAKLGSAVTVVAAGKGLDLFTADSTGTVFATEGGGQVMTAFDPYRHGWHFDNKFTETLFGIIPANGMCGGMAYTSLDYYFLGIPIPTHRPEDFPGGSGIPPQGRLYSMIYNRLIDSFGDRQLHQVVLRLPGPGRSGRRRVRPSRRRNGWRHPRRGGGRHPRRGGWRSARRAGRLDIRRAARSVRVSRRRARGHDPQGAAAPDRGLPG